MKYLGSLAAVFMLISVAAEAQNIEKEAPKGFDVLQQNIVYGTIANYLTLFKSLSLIGKVGL